MFFSIFMEKLLNYSIISGGNLVLDVFANQFGYSRLRIYVLFELL